MAAAGGIEDEEAGAIVLQTTMDDGSMEKLTAAGRCGQAALERVLALCLPGTPCAKLCLLGDTVLTEKLGTVYNHGQVEKGSAFPTCINVGPLVRNYAPRPTKDTTLEAGNVVHVEMAAHVDGFTASVGRTVVIDATQITDPRQARAFAALETAEAVLPRLLRPGTSSGVLRRALERIAAGHGCVPLAGVALCNVGRYIPEGRKVIRFRNKGDRRDFSDEDFVVEPGDAFRASLGFVAADDGSVKESDEYPATIFQRDVSRKQNLRVRAARNLYGKISRDHPVQPFSTAALPAKELVGLKELASSGLLLPFGVELLAAADAVAALATNTYAVNKKKTVCLTLTPAYPAPALADPEAHACTNTDIIALLKSGTVPQALLAEPTPSQSPEMMALPQA